MPWPTERPDEATTIQMAMPIIIKFSVNDMKPSGTLLDPPTHAHFNSRLSMYTALKTDKAPTVPMKSATGTDNQFSAPAIIRTPASPSA